jgi:hypothetical protein
LSRGEICGSFFLAWREKISLLYGGKRALSKGEITMMKAITWGDSFKWSGIVLGLYAAVIGAIAAYEKWIAYKDKAERLDKYNSFRDMDNQI